MSEDSGGRRDPGEELREVLGTALGTAQEQLERQGGFLPFGVVLTEEGELRLVLVTPDGDDDRELDAERMLSDLTELVRQGREGSIAVALASDVHLPEHGTDGVHAMAEHRDGLTQAAVIPYRAEGPEITFLPLEADAHEPTVWTD